MYTPPLRSQEVRCTRGVKANPGERELLLWWYRLNKRTGLVEHPRYRWMQARPQAHPTTLHHFKDKNGLSSPVARIHRTGQKLFRYRRKNIPDPHRLLVHGFSCVDGHAHGDHRGLYRVRRRPQSPFPCPASQTRHTPDPVQLLTRKLERLLGGELARYPAQLPELSMMGRGTGCSDQEAACNEGKGLDLKRACKMGAHTGGSTRYGSSRTDFGITRTK